MVAPDDDLIQISPSMSVAGKCFLCKTVASSVGQLTFQGVHVLATIVCKNCEAIFHHTLPVGHDMLFPITFDETGAKINAEPPAPSWLVRPLVSSIFNESKVEVKIKKIIFEQKRDAIILNCLDGCFGHVFTKLWNAAILREKYPDRSLIVFIPKSMQWLVPDGVSEIWAFDATLGELEKYLTNLDEEVRQNLLPRFDHVWMSKAYTHLSLHKVDLQAMLRTKRFTLSEFSSTKPLITFIVREDRFWHRSSWEFLLFKVFFKLRFSKKVFIERQNRLVSRTARLIRRELPDANFSVAGLGKRGRLDKIITDNRKIRLTDADEAEWCTLYAQSHIVIGIHGSNMLIPTALAAGFIEILPRHKIRHIAEDTLLDYDSRFSLFLGRHVDQYISPKLIAQHAISMIGDFAYLYTNATQEYSPK